MTTALATVTVPAGTPARFTVRPAPRREPPFDDEQDETAMTVGPCDRPLPYPRARRHLVLAPPPASAQRAALPDPAVWARRLLIGIIEAAAGRRPLAQLAPLLSPNVAQGLRSDLTSTAGRHRHWTAGAVLRSVRACEPSDTAAELSATVSVGDRVRAVALRLEIRHGRWCCTRLLLG